MEIEFKRLDFTDDEYIDHLLKWETDPEIRGLITPVFKEEDAVKLSRREDIVKRLEEAASDQVFEYVILHNQKPIGCLQIQIDPQHLYKKVEGTSWLGLTIGDKSYWGTGVAQTAMKFFESKSKELGLKRIELGTFEFNERAYKFYKKLGYQEIGRIPKFTFKDGKFWDDIRMEKNKF